MPEEQIVEDGSTGRIRRRAVFTNDAPTGNMQSDEDDDSGVENNKDDLDDDSDDENGTKGSSNKKMKMVSMHCTG